MISSYDFNISFEMENTVITEFDLFCKKNHLVPLVNSFFMLGILLGSVIFGVLSDLYGRKNILLAGNSTFKNLKYQTS